jgi:putative DNA primase/helicase
MMDGFAQLKVYFLKLTLSCEMVGKNKNDLLEKYEVIYEDDNGKQKINCPQLAKLIYENHGHFFTMSDNKDIYHYNAELGYYEKNGDNIIKNLTEYYLDSQTKEHWKNEVTGWIRDHNYKNRLDVATPLNLINLKNGILDLNTLTLLPHSPEYLFLNKIPVDYKPDASCKDFEEFLNHICMHEQQPKPRKAKTIQEYIGYGLLRSYLYKNYMILDGGGDNAKTTLFNIMLAFYGVENNTSVGLQDLNERPFTKKQLYQRHVNISDDLPKRALKYTGIIKQITGNSIMWADIKNHKDGINFVNYAKPWYACNELPETNDYTDAFFSRQLQMTLTNQYLPKGDPKIDNKTVFERDTNIVEKFTTPEQLSGILNYALIGLKRLQENKAFSDEMTTEEKRVQWTRKTNPVVTYIEDECELGDENWGITVDDFYSELISFCERNEFDKPTSRKYVTERVLDAGLGIKKQQKTVNGTPHTWCWIGVKSATNTIINQYFGKRQDGTLI